MTAQEFGNLYQQNFARTLRFLRTRGVYDAEDVAQEAWTRGFAHRESLRNNSSLVAWVFTIALNVAKSRRRRRSFRHTTDHDLDTLVGFQPQDAAINARLTIQKMARRLTPSRRAALVGALQDLDGRGLGAWMQRSATAAKICKFRALKDLKEQVQNRELQQP